MERYTTLNHIRHDIQNNKITLGGLVLHYLDNIAAKKHLNAFLEVYADEAKAQAEVVQQKLTSGTAGKLAGLVIGLKDNICYKNHQSSASSKILAGFESVYSATVVERLLAEDAIIIGRMNCDEFAMGASNENSAYGKVLNDADNTRVSGGSSGGSAVAVQANLCLATLGSDTGGSIRQPAAFCGVIGYKPTYGRVSRYGLIAYASSFDQIGPITNSIEDTALIMSVIAGADEKDATTSTRAVEAYFPIPEAKRSKIAYIKEALFHPGIDADVKAITIEKIEQLKKAGHTVEEVSFPLLDTVVPAYYVMTTAEASSNLSRFSGLLYGHRSKAATNLETTFKKSRSEGFGAEVKRRIMLGTFVLSAGFYDAYYSKAQKVRRKVQDETEKILSDYDFILSPVTPGTAFKFGEKTTNPLEMYLADIFTVHANISGHPAIAVPAGTHPNGMPVGIQLLGKLFKESELLALAQTI
ncbi:MAG: Asp-tRNA(Asn)/Glu-tRNA(Gln) amidotransferase subunit GatA [Bacteroidota bacterium]